MIEEIDYVSSDWEGVLMSWAAMSEWTKEREEKKSEEKMILDATYKKLDAEVFKKALNLLQTRGWCAAKRLPIGGSGEYYSGICLGLALHEVLFEVSATDQNDYVVILLREARVQELSELYELNDSKSDTEGPLWAADILKAVVAKIEAAQVAY